MKILVCGMPRSMTTWAFNVIRELIEEPRPRSLWIEPDSAGEADFASTRDAVLGKSHHFSQALADAADVVIYSYRDIRTAAVSARRKFGSECTREELEGWLRNESAWLARADLVLRYEDAARDPLGAIAQLRAVIRAKKPQLALATRDDATILRRVDETFARDEAGEAAYDPDSLVLPGHRTRQPSVDALSADEKALYERVGAQFHDWLGATGYASEAHGQDIEYQIAYAFLRAFQAPSVVDIGVERGSFIELALAAGAARAWGFEPLPRHADYLARRFAGSDRVRVFASAVSSASGTAQFHVATDREGRELDFHHTLSDLGDSETVIRSQRSITVKTVSIADCVRDGSLPRDIDFLKIDTDGHDLAVLEGLGDVRPRVIMAEFWDDLPETSGRNPYTLRDLAEWARPRGYPHCFVIRRNAHLELVDADAPWSVAGDWGNVFFVRDGVDLASVRTAIEAHARERHQALRDYVAGLVRDNEAKEAELAAMKSDVDEMDREFARIKAEVGDMVRQLSEKESAVRTAHDALERSERERAFLQRVVDEGAKVAAGAADAEAVDIRERLLKDLENKEKVILELRRANTAYRAAFALFGFVIRPVNKLIGWTVSAFADMAPRLGVLNQHPPRPLAPSAPYWLKTPEAAAPRIAIVTPSYQQGHFLERTIRSVLDQGYPNLQYHVQDGGSTDGTREVLERYSDKLTWVSERDSGQTQAINRGFARVSGDIMAWLNSDDILLPGALAFVADYFAAHPEVDVIYGHRLLIDENDRQIGRWMVPRHNDYVLSWADYVPQETLFWRRRLWEKVGERVDESFRFAMDWDLLVRFRDADARFVRVPRFLGGFRIHPQQKTSAAINEIGFAEMSRIRERALGRVPTQREIGKAVLPYLMRHIAVDKLWRVRSALGARG